MTNALYTGSQTCIIVNGVLNQLRNIFAEI